MSDEETLAAAWRHRDARDGFEVAFLEPGTGGGRRLTGHVAAVEDGVAWAVRYEIDVDAAWRTRGARIRTCTARGMVVVAGESVTADADLARWIDAGADHAASLPPK